MHQVSRAGGRYRIADEPQGGALRGWVVSPFWPMLATMLAGSWLGAPWFVLNALALGSATRRREIAWAVASVAGAAALTAVLVVLATRGVVPRPALRYGVVLVTAWRLLAAYGSFGLQDASFELHKHFGGAVRNGAPFVLVAAFLLARQLDQVLGDAASIFHLVLG